MKTRRRGGGGLAENGDWVLDGEETFVTPAVVDPEAQEAARLQERLRQTIQEMLRSRRVGETFLQDGPCYQVSAPGNNALNHIHSRSMAPTYGWLLILYTKDGIYLHLICCIFLFYFGTSHFGKLKAKRASLLRLKIVFSFSL